MSASSAETSEEEVYLYSGLGIYIESRQGDTLDAGFDVMPEPKIGLVKRS